VNIGNLSTYLKWHCR